MIQIGTIPSMFSALEGIIPYGKFLVYIYIPYLARFEIAINRSGRQCFPKWLDCMSQYRFVGAVGANL
ncbi:MAG: hypothetical protein A2W22_05045 [Candidatus Levybacteria bacterium RBG_16_35_11]|nr:MAG: hypothetical protein A2W22_05045 [Candidatus Levybacteria bacterium RBG_16_35_11]